MHLQNLILLICASAIAPLAVAAPTHAEGLVARTPVPLHRSRDYNSTVVPRAALKFEHRGVQGNYTAPVALKLAKRMKVFEDLSHPARDIGAPDAGPHRL